MAESKKRILERYCATIARKFTQILVFIVIFGGIFGFAATSIVLPIRVGLSNPYVIIADAWMLMEIMLTRAIVPLLALASIALFSLFIGRAACGWLCPFGLINDVIGAIGKRKKLSPNVVLSLWKFALFLAGLFIFIDVSIYYNEVINRSIKGYFGAFYGAPSTFIDPVTPMFSLLFWMTYNDKWPSNMSGWFSLPAEFYWRIFIMIAVIIACYYFPRLYCKALCPLGAVMGLASQYSLSFLSISKGLCNECKLCERVCPMDVPILDFLESGEIRHPQCILCLKCVEACPKRALTLKFG
ncbi:MAG: 4Fe-4S binding protein [Crenarchaeota archaeon]|nr:4Fe-4S binding protein [Thermoproteota archaeon]MCR8454030.1 4Fe-4S binding protein [Thermoproteota archaeon]MCR8454983.1 4Fe-4S binding protein [Thermoproteota archaeon]MCR8463388.1 4Fe-4S binding protein [Thermoproteota archaeon]MCR8470431.1 4Fe-4S binding protein [Thermoproteota archaeon]